MLWMAIPDGRHEQSSGHGKGRQRLRLSIPVGIAFSRRLGCDPQAAPDDHGTHDVESRLNAVRDQGVGVAQNSGDHFDGGQHGAGNDAQDGGPDAARSGSREGGFRIMRS